MSRENLYKIFIEECKGKVCTDTRNVTPRSIFFALSGDKHNGNTYAEQAIDLGCLYAVVDNPLYVLNEKYILVKNSIKALQELANDHRKQFDIPVIGLTGSNGKTTTKELISSVLEKEKNIIATEGNLNNHIGVPLTLLRIKKETEIVIIEMGANHVGEIAKLCEIAQPTHGMITNIGRAHLGLFGGFDGVVRAKTELYRYLEKIGGISFVNGMDKLLLEKSNTLEKITYLSENSEYPIFSQKTLPFVSLKWKQHTIQSNLTGEYNIDNIAAAISVAGYFGLSDENIISGIENYKPQNERSEIKETKKRNMIIKDYYNANRTSMECAIDNLVNIRTEKEKIVILGDMFDLADFSLEEHRAVVEYLLQSKIQNIILVGEYFYEVSGGYRKIMRYKTTDEAIAEIKKQKFKNYVILLKASQGMNFKKIFNEVDW